MGSPSPAATKLKRESPTTRVGPHRRTSSVTSSCVSLESGDQDVQSPARSTGPGKSPVATSTSSPRTPAGVNPGEKSVSPAVMTKRRSSIGGADDLARGLDFSTSSTPVIEEKKLHTFLAKGGGHKKVAQPASVTAQANSPGKKTGTTPPGKEKLLDGSATSASVLSPRKLSDGREINKKDISSPRRPVMASEGSSMNGITITNSELGNKAEQVTPKKSSPLRLSLDGKIGKSSPRLHTKSKFELASTKGRTTSNDELAAIDSSVEAETKTDYKFSPGVSLDGKIGKKSSPRPSLKSKSGLTSSTGRKLTKSRQDTPSPPQPGRVRTRIDKAARNEELSRPELESVEVPVYSENEYEREAKSENAVSMSHKMPAPLLHREADEDRSTLLASLMAGGNVGDEDMSSLERGVEPGFDNDTELPTSWLSEDLPCMFSSLSHLPEPDDSSSSLLGDPPEVLDEPFHEFLNENHLAVPNDIIAAEIARNILVSSAESPVSTLDEKFVAADDPSEVLNGVYQSAMDESAWNYESNSFSMVEDPVDKFEAELRTQIDATYELELQQLSVPPVEDPVDNFEAELRTQIDATYELESQQISVPPIGQEYVMPVAVSQSLLTVDKGETMPYKFTTHPEDTSSSTGDNESSVSESVANEAFLRSTQVNENMLTVEGQSQPISSQIVKDPKEVSQVLPKFLGGDEEICQLDPPSCAEHMSAPNARPTLQEEGRRPTVEDEISTNHSSPDQHVVESSDDEVLEEIIEGSDSAQLNLKQSFDDVAAPLVVSRSRVDEIDISHANIVSIVPVTVGPREDTCDNALEQYTIGPQELALSTESEFAAEFLDGQECGAFTPTYLDEDMKIFEEYWTQSVADESSQSDAGQNDAEDLQPSSTSETHLRNTVEDEAEKSLPPIELPVSNLPVVGKLKLTVEELNDLETPGQPSAEVGATKLEIVDVIEEIVPREGWPCPDSTASLPASDNYQIDTESANREEVEEFDEVFHLFGGSEELRTSAILFDSLSSPSRLNVLPEDHIQEPLNPILSESFEETRFENAGESDSSVSPRYTTSTLGTENPHVVDTAQVVQDLQDRDVEGVTEHQDFSIKTFSVQDASVADLIHDLHNASNSGALGGPADQEPTHEDLGTPQILAVTSNSLLGVHIQHLDDDEASEESVTSEDPDLPIGDPDLSLSTTIQGASNKSSFETPAMSAAHMAVQSDEVLELGPENPSMLQGLEFCASSVQIAERGDMNAALIDDDKSFMSDDCMLEINSRQSSPDRDFAGLVAEVAAETDDSHDLDSEISPKLLMVEGDQNILVSPQSSAIAGAATKEVDPSESNALLPPVSGINDEEQTEANFLSILDKEEESPYGAVNSEGHIDIAPSLGERQERIENSSPDLEWQMSFCQEEPPGHLNTSERAEVINDYSGCIPGGELMSNSTEPKDNFQYMSSESREDKIEVPGHDSSQIYGDDELSQDDERSTIPALQIVVDSHGDANMSEVDHKPQVQLISMSASETLEDCSAEDETPDYVTTAAADKSLPVVLDESSTHILSVACSPVFDEEDEMITDNFDSKSEVNSTASLDMVKPGTGATINHTDTASSAEILGKDEAAHDVAAASIVLSARELPNVTLNEVGEFNRHESECEIDEENSLNEDHSKWGIVDFGEQGRAERDWEGPLLTAHSSGSRPSTEDKRDLLCEESMFTNASSSVEADERHDTTEDLEIDEDKSEETSSIISTSASTLGDIIEYHDPDLQETHLPIGSSISKDDQVSGTEAALEREKALVTSSNAAFDEDLPEAALDDHAIKDVEIVPENCSSQDLPLKLFVTSSQDTPNAAILDVDDMKEDSDFSWKGDKEGENLNGTLQQNRLLKDEDTVVDSPKKSFIVPDQDTVIKVDVNEREEDSSFTRKAERENDYLNGRLEEEPLLEDEETVVFSPKNSFVASGLDTKILDANDIRNHSNISWTAGKDEESLNGIVKEESLLEDEDTVVYSPKDTSDTTIVGANGIQNHSTASWKADSEGDYFNESLEEKTLLKDEDMAVDSPKKSIVVSGQDTTILDIDEMEEQSNSSWTAGKNEESLNRSLERGSVLEDEEMVVPSLKDPFNVSAQETPDRTISGVHDIQNHSNISWTDDKDELESLNGSLKEESLLEDEDTVVYRPMESLVMSGQDLPDTALLVDDKMEEHLDFPEKALKEGKSLNGILMEEATPEVEETVVDNHDEAFGVHVQNNTNAEVLNVDDVEKHATWRDDKEEEESLNGNILEKESVVEVQETVDSPIKPFVVPDQLNANAENLDGDELEKHPTWKTDKEGETFNQSLEEKSKLEVEEMVVDNPKESLVVSGEDNTNAAILDVDELEKHPTWKTDKEGETFNRSLEEKSKLEVEEMVVDNPKESLVVSGEDNTNAAILDVDELEKHPTWKTDKEGETFNRSLEEKSKLEAEERGIDSLKESLVVSSEDNTNAAILDVDELEKHPTWKTNKEGETFNRSLEEKSKLKAEERGVDSSKESLVVSSEDNTNAAISDVDELEKHPTWKTDKEGETFNRSLEEKSKLDSSKESLVVSGEDNTNAAILDVDELEKHPTWKIVKEGESLNRNLEEKSKLEAEERGVDSSKESLVVSCEDNTNAAISDVDELEKHPTWKTDKEGETFNRSLEEKSKLEVEEMVVDNPKESSVVSGEDNTNAAILDVDELEKHPTWKTDKEGETFNRSLEEKSKLEAEERGVDSSKESLVVSSEDNTNAAISDVDELEKHPTWKTDKEGETFNRSLEEKSKLDSSKESLVVSGEDNTNAAISDVDELEKHPTRKIVKEGESLNRNLEEESALEVQETVVDSSSGNVKTVLVCQVPEVNGAIQSTNDSSNYLGEDLVCHSKTEDSAMTPHESDMDAEHISKNAGRVENSLVVHTDHVDEDSNLDKFSRTDAVLDKSCVIPEMTNDNHIHNSDCPHETAASIETPVLAVKTGTSLESNPQDIDSLEEATEPKSPEATLYPLLASQPPFSGSQQDRLWEEQAEAYSSGGRGTPSRNEDATQAAAPFHPPSSPGEQPTSSDDQIQPASGPMNNGHAVVGPSLNGAGENGNALHEPKGNGKGKLHTPLRSLLLEDASKSADGDPSTPNGVTSSPSFIRRLFRVMSTPSRAADREVSQTKLKKSSSMWISCLGSPQVQQ